MSIRTIIEINHDYWQDLRDNPDSMKDLLNALTDKREEFYRLPRGVRILGQRHHSEKLTLTVE